MSFVPRTVSTSSTNPHEEMWLSCKNSINSSPTSPRRSNFHRHSLTKIEDLLGDDDKNVSSSNNYSDYNNNQRQTPKPKPKPIQNPNPKPKPKQKPRATQHVVSSNPTNAKRQSVFHGVRVAKQFTRSCGCKPKPVLQKSQPELNHASTAIAASLAYKSEIKIPGAENQIVIYMTSLRVVRPTFEACRTVRSILQGFCVAMDERDLSMDSSFKEELHKIMSQGGEEKNKLDLPRVFIGGRYVGAAEELRQLNETGELEKLVERLPEVSRGVCKGCSDFRFIICKDCNGSRKCYKDKDGAFRSCTSCNKYGLIRCRFCWTVT